MIINRITCHRVVDFRIPGSLGGWKHLALGLALTEHPRRVGKQHELPLPCLVWLFTWLNCQLLLKTYNISLSQRLWKFELCLWPTSVAECAMFPSLMREFWGRYELPLCIEAFYWISVSNYSEDLDANSFSCGVICLFTYIANLINFRHVLEILLVWLQTIAIKQVLQ